ncbi:SGNH/GDSL hydrolase family protein [Nocardia sp. NPDC050697]|uniref:SGNH/GDSL hydrolase family protein n=1 Tax=Nocardia sp. NPDC050697 TaxID=3155158 RepID=UPI00340F852E
MLPSARLAVAAAAFGALGAVPIVPSAVAGPDSAVPSFDRYVALGDSYASGPGLAPPADQLCERSQRNYGHLVAAALSVREYVDATCGGAVTANLSTSQKPGVPPQQSVLTADTDLVTITIGGNDAGFVEVMSTCGVLGVAPVVPDPCRAHYTRTGTDELARRLDEVVAPGLRAAFAEIRARAPHATIVATTYPRLVPDSGQCWPAVPFAAGDLPYLDALHRGLNDTIAAEAAKAGVAVADVFGPSAGHDACQPADIRWTEPLIGATDAAAHPNRTGMEQTAQAVLAAIDGA